MSYSSELCLESGIAYKIIFGPFRKHLLIAYCVTGSVLPSRSRLPGCGGRQTYHQPQQCSVISASSQLRGGACNPPGVGGGVLGRGQLSGVSKDEEELGKGPEEDVPGRGGEPEARENRILLGTANNY